MPKTSLKTEHIEYLEHIARRKLPLLRYLTIEDLRVLASAVRMLEEVRE